MGYVIWSLDFFSTRFETVAKIVPAAKHLQTSALPFAISQRQSRPFRRSDRCQSARVRRVTRVSASIPLLPKVAPFPLHRLASSTLVLNPFNQPKWHLTVPTSSEATPCTFPATVATTLLLKRSERELLPTERGSLWETLRLC